MKRSVIRGAAVLALLLVLYNVVVLVIPFAGTANFWLAFAFTNVAILAQGYTFAVSFRDAAAKSKFYGYPIARLSVIYLAVQVVLGLAVMAVGAVLPVWVSVVIFCAVLAVAAIGMITADAVREEVMRQDAVLKADVKTMQALRARVSAMRARCSDAALEKAVGALSEALRFSDPVSSPALAEIEGRLTSEIDALQEALDAGDGAKVPALCQRAEETLNERNHLCKLSK